MGTIVVGVDSSPTSGRALDVALVEAASTQQTVRAVHAWTAPVWVTGFPAVGYDVLAASGDLGKIAQELVDEAVDKALSRCEAQPPPHVLRETLQGGAGPALVRASDGASLLVVGNSGLGEVKSALLGSATLYALHHATCPLMVVPPREAPAAPVRQVVVGVDGSLASRAAMRWALEAAARHGCPLIPLHGWLLTTLPGRPPMHYVPSLREYEREAQEWLQAEVDLILPDHRGVEVRPELSHSTASWGLMDKAGPDDLLVIGSRGRGGFKSLLLGSVASQCAQHGQGVTVVVRA